jgi:hypothetical protein
MSADEFEPNGHFELAMPFVLTKSNGGFYDDEAYVAGWNMGSLEADLKISKAFELEPKPRYLPRADKPQIDLLGMKYGYVVHTDELEVEEDHEQYYYGYRFERYTETF